jgi:hypothetical protein
VKVDLRREIESYTARAGTFSLLTVPPMQFLMVDGHGDPNTAQEYQDALASLYPLAYRLKFLSKGELGRDYVVMPLEGLWWSSDLEAFTVARDKSRWSWTMMTLVPEWLGHEHVATARAEVARRGGAPILDAVRLESYDEGLCVQTLHLGSYDDEGPVLAEMHDEVIPGRSLRMTGKHHEIYLSDARRTAPDKLRTILRQPVESAGQDADAG